MWSRALNDDESNATCKVSDREVDGSRVIFSFLKLRNQKKGECLAASQKKKQKKRVTRRKTPAN